LDGVKIFYGDSLRLIRRERGLLNELERGHCYALPESAI
jgi:hypothetical protein